MEIIVCDLNLNLYKMTLNDIPLTRVEFLLVTKFLSTPNQFITHDELASLLWNTHEHYQKHSINKVVSRVKKKLNDNNIKQGKDWCFVSSVHNKGFAFVTKE